MHSYLVGYTGYGDNIDQVVKELQPAYLPFLGVGREFFRRPPPYVVVIVVIHQQAENI
jgi:hypothetical protein